MGFEDHFSTIAKNYSRFRPRYPEALFDYLSSLAPGNELAWDCGAGNGQAAASLASRFRHVTATDASREQISHAQAHPRVDYRVEQAEDSSLPSGCCDLITSAVAVHWFNFDRFYETVRRVLRPGGVLAVWTYHLLESEAEIDALVQEYYAGVLAGYWPERIRYLAGRYRTLPFPFEEIPPPALHLEIEWDLNQLAGFLASWSAAQKYLEENGRHPLEVIWPRLSAVWGDAEHRRLLRWPLYLRVGRPAPPKL